MAWTNITNAQLAIGAPIRSIDLLALRDNITAQANGDSGAPQQQTAGIADNAVTAKKINKGNGLGASGSTLVINCPSWGSVGSYATGIKAYLYTVGTTPVFPEFVVGSNYSASSAGIDGGSGTWKCMGYTGSRYTYYTPPEQPPTILETERIHLFCRVA